MEFAPPSSFRSLLPSSGVPSAAAETEDEVESGLLLDVVVGEGSAVLELLAGEDEPLLVRRDAFLVLDLGLDPGTAHIR